MVLYLVQIDVPPQHAEAFSRFQAGHVAKNLAAMGRSAVGMRARVQKEGEPSRFFWFFELPSLSALEAYLTSREREEFATELSQQFPEAKVHLSFGELAGNVRRGMRYGEEPGAAFVLDISLPKGKGNGLTTWYDEEQIPRALAGNGFVRARRFEIHGDEDQNRYLVVLDAVDVDAIRSYENDGQKVLPDPDGHAPEAKVERSLWEWMRESPAGE